MSNYSKQTYEAILNRMLSRVPNDIDKREGSIIYDALAPAAAELAEAYIELDNILTLAFTQTSNGEWLEKRCAEQGIYRKEAVKAQRKGSFNIEIPLGTRFRIDDINYIVKEELNIAGENKEYILECETAGSIGNNPIGSLIPITYINGLETAILSDILIPGADKEDDTSLYKRYKQKVEKPSTSGNIHHYTEWATEVNGVGAARVIPVWDGPNTVKILIVDSDMQPATTELVNEVQRYIDPNQTGLGEGVAPIGAVCTVESAEAENIDVSATINGADPASVATVFNNKLKDYLMDITKSNWQVGNTYAVSYAMIGSLLLESVSSIGGSDYSNLTVNGGIANIQLTDKVPVVGVVTLI